VVLEPFPASLFPTTTQKGGQTGECKGCLTADFRRNTMLVSSPLTFIRGGPIGSILCEKMQFTREAKVPYIQMMDTNASMATVKRKRNRPQCYA